jgi:ferric-dicitrate binding protein FerR (iron transport regulator)
MAGRDPLLQGGTCDRAREWVSRRLDGELSPLEAELLDRHLEACADCRVFEDDVRWATDVLRLTPQERPSRRVTLPAPARARLTGRRLTAVAAAASLAAGALVGALVERPSSQAPATGPTEVSLLSNDVKQLRDLPRTRILSPVQPSPGGSPSPPEGVI